MTWVSWIVGAIFVLVPVGLLAFAFYYVYLLAWLRGVKSGDAAHEHAMELLNYWYRRAHTAGHTRRLAHKITKSIPGYVYVAESGGRYKIGFSKAPKKRLRSLNTSSPAPIRIIDQVYYEDAGDLERTLHERYNEYRLQGEWFAFTEDGLADLTAYLDHFREEAA